ncbi:MAG: hypothetical protein IIC13_18545 [SAR324 cluster bacterium]|nr:hypothetical protein [SAR324 cluster bacterium]
MDQGLEYFKPFCPRLEDGPQIPDGQASNWKRFYFLDGKGFHQMEALALLANAGMMGFHEGGRKVFTPGQGSKINGCVLRGGHRGETHPNGTGEEEKRRPRPP